MADRTTGPIKTKLGTGTHVVDPGSVLVKVKVKVIWRHLVNANKTPYKGGENSSAKRDSLFRPEDGYLQLVSYIR